MDFSLSPETLEFGHRVRAWIDDNLPADYRGMSAAELSDDASVAARRGWAMTMFQHGYAGPTWPKEYGGMGLDVEEQFVYLREFVSAGAPDPLNSNAIGVFGPCLMKYGTEEQRANYLSKMLSNEEIWSQGFSEPGAGSDLASLSTRATRTPGGYLINGQKVWTTNAAHADRGYLLARTSAEAGKGALTMFVVDMNAPGVTPRPLKNIAGSTEFGEVFYENVFIPDEDVVGEVGDGWSVAMFALSQERTSAVSYRALRMRKDLQRLRALIDRLSGPDVLSDPSSAVFQRFGELVVATRTVEAIVLRNLALISAGEDLGAFSSMVILTWSQATQRLYALASELLGNAGLEGSGPDGEWLRSLLFVRSATIAGGTSQIQRNGIAKTIGLPSARR